jgi:argininosuccinate synthase
VIATCAAARNAAVFRYVAGPSRICKSSAEGTALGIAFSGGLDTRAAVAWMSENGMAVHAYTADLAQPDEANPADIPPIALQHGAVKARLIDCRDAMVREGSPPSSAARSTSARAGRSTSTRRRSGAR